MQLTEAGDIMLRTSSWVVAQIWRDGSRQARLACLLGGEAGGTEVEGGHVANLAMKPGTRVLTSDWGVPTEAIIRCLVDDQGAGGAPRRR